MKAAQGDVEKLPELESKLASMKEDFSRLNDALTNGTMKIAGKVEVTNPQAFGGGGPSGREGVPDHS
jgi:hypothetical protein